MNIFLLPRKISRKCSRRRAFCLLMGGNLGGNMMGRERRLFWGIRVMRESIWSMMAGRRGFGRLWMQLGGINLLLYCLGIWLVRINCTLLKQVDLEFRRRKVNAFLFILI